LPRGRRCKPRVDVSAEYGCAAQFVSCRFDDTQATTATWRSTTFCLTSAPFSPVRAWHLPVDTDCRRLNLDLPSCHTNVWLFRCRLALLTLCRDLLVSFAPPNCPRDQCSAPPALCRHAAPRCDARAGRHAPAQPRGAAGRSAFACHCSCAVLPRMAALAWRACALARYEFRVCRAHPFWFKFVIEFSGHHCWCSIVTGYSERVTFHLYVLSNHNVGK
jgi:hypothetical protein